MQHEVTDVQKLLDKQGYVVTPGWARRPVWQYNRENIAAPSFRIKEWDYYLAGNEHYAYGTIGTGEDIGRWQCGFQKWSDSSSLYGEAA